MPRLCALLLLVAACTPSDPFPQDLAKRRATLSESVLSDAAALSRRPERADDAGLAVAQVVITGHAPRLRLLVTGDNEPLARGAATALVRILVHREEDDRAALEQCAKGETNDYVRERCREVLGGTAVTEQALAPIEQLLEADETSSRLDGLRRLLSLREPFSRPSKRVDSALLHLVRAEDPSIRLLATAAFLRRSLSVGSPPRAD